MNKFFAAVAFVFCFVLLLQPAIAQETMERWAGVLDVGAQKLRLELHIKKAEDGKLSGSMISLDQGGLAIPFDTVEIGDGFLKWEIKMILASYSGKLNAEGNEAEGDFKQGQKFKVKFTKMGDVAAPKHVATYQGKMVAGPQEFDFQFRLFDTDGQLSIRLDSFTEKIGGLPGNITIDGEKFTIDLPVTKATFKGTINAERTVATGKWIQGGNEFPLTINKVPIESTRDISLNRPQTPKPPFGYDSEDVEIVPSAVNRKYEAGVKLSGTLTTPKGDGPFPAVIMISGSGPQDRDETIFGHKSFLVIADHLAKRGIATLRYDERGVGRSIGNFNKATSVEFAADVEAQLDWLQKNKKINKNKIALVGHSEGGLIAPMIAARRNDVAAIVLLAGPGVPGKQIAINQSRLIARASGASESILEFQDKLLADVLAQTNSAEGLSPAFVEKMTSGFKTSPPEGLTDEMIDSITKMAVTRLDGDWMKFFLEYDPEEALTKTKCPVLAIVGEKDLQVDPDLNMPVIESALKAGGNRDYQLKRFPNLNHLFQNCDKGTPDEYVNIEETFDVAALEFVGDWLEKRLK